MVASTRIRSPVAAVAVLAIERTPAGHAIAELRRGTRVAPRILDRSGTAVQAAFVPTQAGPLAGDRDSARIVVGAGATLVVEPVAATLALPGAARTALRLDVTVRESGRLVLDEGPLIVAAGADVQRHCAIELGVGAVAAVRETVVLGRDSEPPGALDSTLRATLAGRPLVHDGLRVGDGGAYVALAPGHRVVTTLALLGMRPATRDPGVLELEGPGALARATGAAMTTTDAALAGRWSEWTGAALGLHAPSSGA